MNQNSSAYSGIAHNLNKFLSTSLHNLAYTPVEKKKRKGEGKRVKHEKKQKQKQNAMAISKPTIHILTLLF